MKKLFAGTILTVLSAMSLPMSSVAQDKFEASVGADLVSSYIWRGQDLGNASIQPALSLSYKGISLSAWGSAVLRVDKRVEEEGLDIYEHGESAYNR